MKPEEQEGKTAAEDLDVARQAVDSNVREFTGTCGQNGFVTSPIGLQVNERVSIDGNTDLHLCMQGNSNACVYGITLSIAPGPLYKFVLNIDAQGPYGITSGTMDLHFIDQTGDTYDLSIFDSHRKMHTVSFNSDQPAIVKIAWQ